MRHAKEVDHDGHTAGVGCELGTREGQRRATGPQGGREHRVKKCGRSIG